MLALPNFPRLVCSIAVATCLGIATPAFAAETADDAPHISKKVSEEEAKALASAAIGRRHFDDMYVTGPLGPDFVMAIAYAHLSETEDMAATVAVNVWTGAVWNMYECRHRYRNRILKRMQAEIRARFNAQESKRYRELDGIYPGCYAD